MAKRKKKDSSLKDMTSWKPGSDPDKAPDVAAKGDFGVPEGHSSTRDRDYVSRNTKASDRGNAQPRSGEEEEGVRTSGAGGHDSGVGSSSGGDLDTDILGVGTAGSGISASGPDDRIGQDESDGSSAEFASGPPAKGENQTQIHKIGGARRPKGSVSRPSDDQAPGQGADAATPASRDNDSFAGEISSGEASGQDEPIDPARRPREQ